MKQTSTREWVPFKKCLVLFLTIIGLSFSQSLWAHSVTGYTPGCNSGPTYTITPIVTNVNSTSNYAWQWKDVNGAWICISNGSNLINGVTYNVSGATSTLTTNPAPLVFTNPNIGLQGLVVRCVISDGAGVNPCSMPVNNTWNSDASSVNITINVSNTPCGSYVCPVLSHNAFTNFNSSSNAGVATSLWLSVETKLTASTLPNNGDFLLFSGGTLTLNNITSTPAVTNSAIPDGKIIADNTVSVPTTTYSSVTNSWTTKVPPGYASAGIFITAGIFNSSNGFVAASGKNSVLKGSFYSNLPQFSSSWFYGLACYQPQFTYASVAGANQVLPVGGGNPAGTPTTQTGHLVAGGSGGGGSNYTGSNSSTDGYTTCLSPNSLKLGDRVWYDTNNNGINDASENGIANVTVNLYKDDNNDNIADGPAIATTTTNSTGYYSFSGLTAGNYIVGVVIPNGYMSSSVNGGDPDNNIDLDDNGQVADGNEIRGLGITLAVGTEPTNGSTNNTYDFGLLPDCTCTTSAGNLLVNGSFENGTTGWSWSGGTLTTGTGYIACGLANGFNNWSTGTSKVWQDVALNAVSTVTFKGFAGTHTPGIACSPTLSLIFLNAANTVLGQSNVTVTRDVDINNSQLEQYSITASVPVGTTKVRVQSSITCNTMKIDAFCLTATPSCVGGGTWNLNLPAGTLGTSQAYTVNGVTITAYGFSNGNPGTPTALYGKNDGGNENGVGINSNINHEIDIDHFVQLDLNQVIAANATAATMMIGSMQAGEPANVYGSNTLGVIGTLLMTVPVTLDNTPFAMPGYPAYRYISVRASAASPADVLLQQVSFSCPPPASGSIGDRVWKDDNANGIQDAGEVGIAGVTLTLLNAAGQVIGTTTTDAFGIYKFSNLPAGNYSVRIAPPANYVLSPKTQGPDVNFDSDFDIVSYTTGTVTLTTGQNRTDIDAGLNFKQIIPASVGDRVWLDLNGDGVQDAGEPGVSHVLVTLYDNTGNAVRYTYTDVNGLYLFTDVTPGSYTVGVSLPPAFVFSPNNGVVSGATNSDIIPATGRTASFTVNAGDQITYVDAGIKTQVSTNGSIGDYVWNDINKNGIQDAGEQGIAGTTVRLINAATNTVLATTTTDITGYYIFNDVPAGSYQVEFVTPAGGYTTTTKLSTDPLSSNTDSDVDPATSRTAIFTLGNGQRVITVDAGYWLTNPGTAKLGDFVWHDLNQNGIQDAGEPGVGGITVTLYNSTGTVLKQAVTPANGSYLFTDLAAGNYTVGFSNLPAGFTFTTAGAGTAATGSDADPATGKTASITLVSGQVNLDVDAGIRSSQAGAASLGNRVWYDLNNNGLQDAGEPGVQGVTVELLDAAGNPVDKDPVTAGVQPTTTLTNALGEYLFTGLAAGDYKVRFSTLPAGYVVVTKGAGTNRELDSDGNPLAGGTSTTDLVGLAANEDRLDIDLGIFNPTAPLGQIGDFVWFDANNNGIQDAGEQGVPGVTVSLLNTSGVAIATTVTDGNGNYKFVNLADGTYSVKFSNLPAGFSFSPKDLGGNDNTDSDPDPITGITGTYVISGGNSNMTVDAGIYSTRAALGDYVWLDGNANGTQDATEKGIAGVTVILYNASNVAVTSAITDQNGRYFFSNLNPGTYTVGFGTTPLQTIFTLKDAVAAGDNADSDVDPATGKTGAYTLVAGQVNLTVDAGLRPYIPASVGDFVWYDLNRDGLQTAGEPGVPGVIVTMYNSANQAVGSAVTDGNGYYLISNVTPGAGYYLKFSNQPDLTAPWTLQNVGGVAANDNSKVDATGQTGAFSVAEGQNITNLDAGIYKIFNLSGNVWHDVNGMTDGLVNDTRNTVIPPGAIIPTGLRITRVDAVTGIVLAVALVQGNGAYNFPNVPPGNYTLILNPVPGVVGNLAPFAKAPDGWGFTGEHLGLTPGNDGPPNGKLSVSLTTFSITNANFGILFGGDIGVD